MGTLFPDDDEYPDHRPLPARLAHVSRRVAYWVVAAFFTLWDLRPGSGAQADPPQREVYQLCPAAAHQVSTGGDIQIAIPTEALHFTETVPTLAVSS